MRSRISTNADLGSSRLVRHLHTGREITRGRGICTIKGLVECLQFGQIQTMQEKTHSYY